MAKKKIKIIGIGLSRDIFGALNKNFEPQRFKFINVSSAQELAKEITKEKTSLIFLNNVLPDVSNYQEICIALRSRKETETVPIIVLANRQEDPQTKIQLFKSGLVEDYVVLPASIEEISAKSEVYLEKQILEEELESKNTLLQKISITDALTKVYNRRYLVQRMNEEINKVKRYGYSVSCLMLDIDYFKKINDKYGHQQGDHVLKVLASLIKKNIRNVDIISRYGGDEMIILFPHTDLKGACVVTERLRTKIKETNFGQSKTPLKLTVSLGLVSFDKKDSLDGDSLMRAMDRQLYRAKQTGRDKICAANYCDL